MTLQRNCRISTLDLRHTGSQWAFAEREHERIAAHWQQLAEANPALWNGEVLMCHTVGLADGRLTGRFLTTDYASFVAWRDWGWPDRSMCNCFGSAVVLSNDGALIYGRMSEATLNPGGVYPPGGSLEPLDLRPDGTVDVQGSIERELEEETGLKAGEADAGEWIAIFDGRRLCLGRAYRFDLPARAIVDRVNIFLENVAEEELDGVEIIRSASQIDSRMPGYAAEIARHFLGNR
jgi:8-oxo-dGTP pyrophosphatase MutT (NUDIX family)